jgi:hypothetical protein
MAKLVEIFSFSKGFRLYKLLLKCESLLLLTPTFLLIYCIYPLLDLTGRGQKAFFKLKNIFNNIPCSAPYVMHIFDHTVKPVLLSASEIVGLFNNNKNVGVNSNNDSHLWLRWEVIVRLVDIGVIVENHCLNCLFLIQ